MRPQTLAEAVERIEKGEPQDVMLAEFVDTFDLQTTGDGRYSSIEQEPKLTGNSRLDALVGAMAEYLAKQRKLGTRAALGLRSRPTSEQSLVYGDRSVGCHARILDLQQSRRVRVA